MRLMGVPASEAGYTSATTGMGHVVAKNTAFEQAVIGTTARNPHLFEYYVNTISDLLHIYLKPTFSDTQLGRKMRHICNQICKWGSDTK
jgi:hypothetical protein